MPTPLIYSLIATTSAWLPESINFLALKDVEFDLWQKLIRIGMILLVSYILGRIVLMLIGKYKKLALLTTPEENRDVTAKRVETIGAILRNAAIVLMVSMTFFILLSEVGINIAPLLAGAGIAGIAIGFGAQSLVKDLFYGFFILLENQFGMGDVVQIGGATGEVIQMTLRTVTLRDVDGRIHIIPNGDASKVVVHTHGWSFLNLNLEVAMETDMDKALAVIETVSEQVYQQHSALLLEKPNNLGIDAIGPNGIVIKIMAKTPPQKHFEISRIYRKAILKAFNEAGIQIPTAQPAALPSK